MSRSTAGRLFAPDGELRWRVIPALGEACWRTIFLGRADWTGAALEDRSEYLRGLQPWRERFFLWGQQSKASLDWVTAMLVALERSPAGLAAMRRAWRSVTRCHRGLARFRIRKRRIIKKLRGYGYEMVSCTGTVCHADVRPGPA